MDVLPEEYNPPRGFVSSANGLNLPPDYPIAKYPVGFEWSAPWRHGRLKEALGEQDKHAPADSEALQRDYRSLLAVRMVAALRQHFPSTDTPEAQDPALALLTAWDGELGPESAAAALYNVWFREHLTPAVAGWLVGSEAATLVRPIDAYTVLTFARHADAAPLLKESLAAAWQDTQQRLGPNPDLWRWGDLHQIRFQHPLLGGTQEAAATNRDATLKAFELPAYPRGGNGYTANATSMRGEGFEVTNGASFRMVLDVGNWDAATMTNAPGQSGDPRSPYYGNLLEGWATEQSFPLIYSAQMIEEHAQLRIELQPTAD